MRGGALRFLGGLLLLAGCGDAAPTPADGTGAESATARVGSIGQQTRSEAGHYLASVRPQEELVRVGALHRWIANVATADGRPLTLSRLVFSAGMPQHGHGTITRPVVTRELGPGEYLVDGVKFHMAGDWTLVLSIDGEAGPDRVVFQANIAP